MAGLVSDLERKNAEGIAYLHDQERQGLQKFLGQAAWDDPLLLTELAHQVGAALGEPGRARVGGLPPLPPPGSGPAPVEWWRQSQERTTIRLLSSPGTVQ